MSIGFLLVAGVAVSITDAKFKHYLAFVLVIYAVMVKLDKIEVLFK